MTTEARATAADPVPDPLFGDYPARLAPLGIEAPGRRARPELDARLAACRMPAEWEPHERTLLTWPTRQVLWDGLLAEAKREFAAVVRGVADFEPVTVLAPPGCRPEVLDATGSAGVDVFEVDVDDSWIRDNGPLVVTGPGGLRLGVDFRFNSWGEKFLPFDRDAAASAVVLDHLGIERIPVDMVLEGGSISIDGAGTLVTTEQCLLHSNRNPDLSKADIDAVLSGALGVSRVLWLPSGHVDDRHTDGHVDGVCTFTAPGRAIVQTCGDPRDVNHEAMARNLRYLRDNEDAAGTILGVRGLDLFPGFELNGVSDFVAYANFYVCNGAVIVPVSGRPDMDGEALAVIAEEFPGREVIGVPATIIAYGGGGPHCITMQIPLAGAAGSL
ncbi:MAG: agmatine deiminase family protein [Streptosporangiaceae bacterium]